MQEDERAKLKEIFHAAIELTPAEREPFLNHHHLNSDMRREIESLIYYHEKATNFLEKPPPQTVIDQLKTFIDFDFTQMLGKHLDKQYHIDTLLGIGGMGAVYRARHSLLDSYVAIKIMSPKISEDSEYKELFFREGRAAAIFRHPNAVNIYDFRESEEGILYMVFEYLEGETLRSILNNKGHLSIREALDILRPIANALDSAHEKGVIHRDLKPSNIMISFSNKKQEIKLLDLGIAKITGSGDSHIKIKKRDARISQALGTPHYMSPEQWQGRDDIDGRTDIYSLGVIFYELLSGKKPFEGDIEELSNHHLNSTPPLLYKKHSGIPKSFSFAITRAMAKNRDNRPSTCEAFINELENSLKEGEPKNLNVKEQKLRPAISALLLLLTILSVTLYLSREKPSRTEILTTNTPTKLLDLHPLAEKESPTERLELESGEWRPSKDAFITTALPVGYWKGTGRSLMSSVIEGRKMAWFAKFTFFFQLDNDGVAIGEAEIAYDNETIPVDTNVSLETLLSAPENSYLSTLHIPIVGLLKNKSLVLEMINLDKLDPLKITFRIANSGSLIMKVKEQKPFSPFSSLATLEKKGDKYRLSSKEQKAEFVTAWEAEQIDNRKREKPRDEKIEAAILKLKGQYK